MLATPQDAGRTATEQKDAFKSSAGGFTYRHHVALRGQMYVPDEPSFPILVKYGDAIRQTKTTFEKKKHWRLLGRRWHQNTLCGMDRFQWN